jgi:thiol-disulfide isomerase/thioredoxin
MPVTQATVGGQVDEARAEALKTLDALYQRILPFMQIAERQPELDWEQTGFEVAAIAAKLPDYFEWPLPNLVNATLYYSKKHSKDHGVFLREALLTNPNAQVREMAAGDDHISLAKVAPMKMSFTAVDGRSVDLSALQGKVVLIDFWAATWCGACKVQEPLMKEVYARYHEVGFEIVGIACEMKESDRAFLMSYVKEHAMPWPQYFDGRGMRNEYSRRYGFTSLPQYFLLGRDGLLIAHTQGSAGLRNLEAVVRRLLDLPPLHRGDENRVLGTNHNPVVN